MLHAKKADTPLVHPLFKIMQEIAHDRADEIKPQPGDQLYVRNGGGDDSCPFVNFGIGLFAKPAPVGSVNGECQTKQNKPADKRVKWE